MAKDGIGRSVTVLIETKVTDSLSDAHLRAYCSESPMS
jgi:hypothetical protein